MTASVLACGRSFAIICQDGSQSLTSGGAPLYLPSRKLAELIAEENQSKQQPYLTKMAEAAIDIMPEAKASWLQQTRHYAMTDLLCHLAPSPRELQQRQQASWRPIRQWAADQGIELEAEVGIMPIRQSERSLDEIVRQIGAIDDFLLTGFVRCMALTGSALLALAMMRGQIAADSCLAAATIEENWQTGQWGEDHYITTKTNMLKDDLDILERWFRALDRPS